MSDYGSGSGTTPPGDQSNMPAGASTPGPQMAGPGPQPAPYSPGPAPDYTPPPGGVQMPVTNVAPPPRQRSPLLIIGVIVLALVLVCGIGGALLIGGVLNATQPLANAGDAYMTALRDGDYNKAFDLSAPSLQQEAGNAAGLEAALSSKQPATWAFTSRNISNGQGSLSGTTTYKTGESGTVDMSLTQVGNDWKVVGISLK